MDDRLGQVTHLVAEQQTADLAVQSAGQFPRFGQQFQADIGDDAFLLFDENPNVP
jgi:hypothetical protein